MKEPDPKQGAGFQGPPWEPKDFHALILEILQEPTTNDSSALPIVGNQATPLLHRVIEAAKHFGEGAANLSRAFLWSAATGKPVPPEAPSPECGRLREEMRELLNQLQWLERGDTNSDPDDNINTPQGQWAAETLATAVRLKILQRASHYCRLAKDTPDNSRRAAQVQTMHRYYLGQLTRLKRPPIK